MNHVIIALTLWAAVSSWIALVIAKRFFGLRTRIEAIEYQLDVDADFLAEAEECEKCGGAVVETVGPGRYVQVAPILSIEIAPNLLAPQCAKCSHIQPCHVRDMIELQHEERHGRVA